MTKTEHAEIGASLRDWGFDESYYNKESGGYRIRCSQCQALVINGIACHETGCPNQVRKDREDE